MNATAVQAVFTHETGRDRHVEVVGTGPWESAVSGLVRRGSVLGNCYHKQTRVYLFVIQGEARVSLMDIASGARRSRRVGAMEGLLVEPNQAHVIRFTQDSTYLLLRSLEAAPCDADTFAFAVDSHFAGTREAESGAGPLTYFPL